MKRIFLAAAVAVTAYSSSGVIAEAQTLRAQEMTSQSNRTSRAPQRQRATRETQSRQTSDRSFFGCTVNLSGRCQRTRNTTGRRTSSLLRY